MRRRADLNGKNPLSLVRGRVQLLGAGGIVPGVVGRRGKEDKLEWAELYVDIGARSRSSRTSRSSSTSQG